MAEDENPFAGIAKLCSNEPSWQGRETSPLTSESFIESMKKVHEHYANPNWKPPPEIVSREEYEWRQKYPGANHMDWLYFKSGFLTQEMLDRDKRGYILDAAEQVERAV